MKRFVTLVGMAAFVVSACGAGASPTPTPAPATPTAAPTATPAPSASPSPASLLARLTFDGEKCSYEGPAAVKRGTQIVWEFENTPAAIKASNEKGAKSIGSDLIILPVRPGTTWDEIVASPPTGIKGVWGLPDWALLDEAQNIPGSTTTGRSSTKAFRDGYVVMCNLYWDYDTGQPLAIYYSTLIQVLEA